MTAIENIDPYRVEKMSESETEVVLESITEAEKEELKQVIDQAFAVMLDRASSPEPPPEFSFYAMKKSEDVCGWEIIFQSDYGCEFHLVSVQPFRNGFISNYLGEADLNQWKQNTF